MGNCMINILDSANATQQVITLVDNVSKSLDKGKIVSGVYIDIRKAFNSISH